MKIKNILIIAILFNIISYGQYDGKKFSVGVNAVYTTTAKIYLSPNSSDQTIRNSFFPIDDIVNPAFDFKYRFTDQIIIGLGTEYMKKTKTGRNLTVFSQNQTQTIEVQDGFILIPFELSVYYILPFSTERFKFLMGGGGALYYGEHIRKFGDVEVSNLERKTAYGIHVMATMDFLIRKNIGIHSEMKFRDPQFNVTSKYNNRTVMYNNETVTLAQDSFSSKINIDGVTFIAGLVFYF